MNDIIGQKFGLWTVLRRDEQKHSGGSYYICRCECGTERAIVKHDLISGKSWHCGCQSEKVRKRTTELILQRKLNGEYQNKPIDIIGRRYGKLVVLEQLTPGFASRSDFRCRCDCGNEVIKSYNALQAGVRSCGCLSKEKRFDLHGKKFGRLTVLEYISPQNIENEIPSKQRWKNSYGGWIGMWKCRCECGSICYVSTRSLLQGNITSCGCVDKREDLTGKRFGRLVVLEEIPIGDEFYNKFKKRKSDYWKCKCDCGKITCSSRYNLESGRKISCGCFQSDKAKKGVKIAHIMHGDVDGTNVNALCRALDGKKYANNSSGFTGVYQMKNGRYRAQINFKKKNIHLGYYENYDDAVSARKDAELVLFKGFLDYFDKNLKAIVDRDVANKKEKAMQELVMFCKHEHDQGR